MTILDTYIVPDSEAEQYLYDIACMAFAKIIPSRKGIKKAIRRQAILVDGQVGQSGWKLRSGQKIELLDTYVKIPKSYELKVPVLYEDEQCAVVHKPHGLITSGNQFRNLYNTLGYNLNQSKADDALPYPTPAHRLDSETSGCVLIAKTKSAQIRFNKLFSEKKIEKTYIALVHGKTPISGYINFPINGQLAETKFERTELVKTKKGEFISKVKMYPLTGRTHQLRIHFSKIGHPIVGDKLYGRKGNIVKHKGLFLCAISLRLDSVNDSIKVKTKEPRKFSRFICLVSKL